MSSACPRRRRRWLRPAAPVLVRVPGARRARPSACWSGCGRCTPCRPPCSSGGGSAAPSPRWCVRCGAQRRGACHSACGACTRAPTRTPPPAASPCTSRACRTCRATSKSSCPVSAASFYLLLFCYYFVIILLLFYYYFIILLLFFYYYFIIILFLFFYSFITLLLLFCIIFVLFLYYSCIIFLLFKCS